MLYFHRETLSTSLAALKFKIWTIRLLSIYQEFWSRIAGCARNAFSSFSHKRETAEILARELLTGSCKTYNETVLHFYWIKTF